MEWPVYAVVFLLFDKSLVQPHNFAFALSIFLQNRLEKTCYIFLGKERKDFK